MQLFSTAGSRCTRAGPGRPRRNGNDFNAILFFVKGKEKSSNDPALFCVGVPLRMGRHKGVPAGTVNYSAVFY